MRFEQHINFILRSQNYVYSLLSCLKNDLIFLTSKKKYRFDKKLRDNKCLTYSSKIDYLIRSVEMRVSKLSHSQIKKEE